MGKAMKYLKHAIIAIAVIGIGAGVWFSGVLDFGGGHGEEGGEEVKLDSHGNPLPPVGAGIYLSMDPAFVVNFTHRGTLHYLQLELDLMYHDQKIIDKITSHMPAVRNDLIMLFSNQEFEKLISAEGKEELRQEILLAVNNVAGIHPDPDTGAMDGEVYITHFVMQ